MPSSRSSMLTQAISDAVSDKERYSASVELLDTVGCFLDDQDIKFWPRNVQNPPVDLLVAGQPAQSLSLYARRVQSVSLSRVIPIVTVPLTYRRILFRLAKSDTEGACIFWQM